MKRKIIFLWLLLPTFSQSLDWDLGLLVKDRIKKPFLADSPINPSNILELSEDPENNFEVSADLKLFLSDRVSLSVYDALEVNSRKGSKTTISNKVRELYASFNLNDYLFLDAGIIVFKKGVGFFKNPSDLIEYSGEVKVSKSKDEKFEELEGVKMFRLQWFWNDFTLSLVFAPELSPSAEGTNQVLMSVGYQGSGFDVELIGYEGRIWKTALNSSAVLFESVEVHGEMAVWEKTKRYELHSIYGFPSVSTCDVKNPVFVLAGLHFHTFLESEVYFEYYFHSSGISKTSWDNSMDLVGKSQPFSVAFAGIVRDTGYTELQKHYAMFRWENREGIADAFTFSFTAVVEFYDFGAMLIPAVSWSGEDFLSVELTGMVSAGSDTSEFRTMPFSPVLTFEVKGQF